MQSYFPPSPNPPLTTTSSSNITGLTLGLKANTLTSQRNVLLLLDTPRETWHLKYLSVHRICLCLLFFLTWKISKLLIMTGHRVKVFVIFSCEQNYLLNVWLGLEGWLSQKRHD